jgi:hypothetical protein
MRAPESPSPAGAARVGAIPRPWARVELHVVRSELASTAAESKYGAKRSEAGGFAREAPPHGARHTRPRPARVPSRGVGLHTAELAVARPISGPSAARPPRRDRYCRPAARLVTSPSQTCQPRWNCWSDALRSGDLVLHSDPQICRALLRWLKLYGLAGSTVTRPAPGSSYGVHPHDLIPVAA